MKLGLNPVTFNNTLYITINVTPTVTVPIQDRFVMPRFAKPQLEKPVLAVSRTRLLQTSQEPGSLGPRWSHQRQSERELCQVPVRV